MHRAPSSEAPGRAVGDVLGTQHNMPAGMHVLLPCWQAHTYAAPRACVDWRQVNPLLQLATQHHAASTGVVGARTMGQQNQGEGKAKNRQGHLEMCRTGRVQSVPCHIVHPPWLQGEGQLACPAWLRRPSDGGYGRPGRRRCLA